MTTPAAVSGLQVGTQSSLRLSQGSTRLHPFTIPLHHSHRFRHAQNYGQVGIWHRLAEAEPLNGFGLRW